MQMGLQKNRARVAQTGERLPCKQMIEGSIPSSGSKVIHQARTRWWQKLIIMDKNLKIEYIDPRKLKPYERNPRSITPDAMSGLKASIEAFGIVDPFVVNSKHVIIGGHQRCRAAIEMGYDRVPVVYVDLLPEREKALNVALNNKHIAGEWTPDLGDLLGEIKADLPDLFDDLKMEPLLLDVPEVKLEPVSPETDPDEVPEAPKEPVIQRGDIVMLGKHRILCGDSCSPADVEWLMAGKLANIVQTDPPYGVSYADKNKYLNFISPGNRIQTPIENDHESAQDMKRLWTDSFSLMATYLRDGGVYYIHGPQGGELAMMMMSIVDSGLELKHMLIWVKNNHVLGRCDYNYKHEPILYGWKPGAGHKFYADFDVSTWEVNKPLKSELHPTQKPVELAVRAIKNSSKTNDIILDVFLGSGFVLIASEQLNRVCYGMELSPNYVQVATERWINFTGRPEDVTVERGGKTYAWQELLEVQAK